MREFEMLLGSARRKSKIDEGSSWSSGAKTYLSEIKKEIDEVIGELKEDRVCYLEDELGDVLWDYLNVLLALEEEAGVTVEAVLNGACKKYEERISGIESGELWKDVKERQRVSLESKQKSRSST